MKINVVIIIIAALVLACGQTVKGEKNLSLQADYATFYIPSDTTTYIEFYYSLYQHELGFLGSEDNDYRYAGVLISATLFDEAGNKAGYASSYFISQVEDESRLAETDIRLFDYLPVKISPGHYRVELSAIDDVSKATGNVNLLVSVPDYSQPGLAVSDLELAYEIRTIPEDSIELVNSRLIKEGRLVMPNPTGVYQPGVDTALYVYAELYGLAVSENQDDEFLVRYLAKDSLGNVVHDYGQKRYEKPGSAAVLTNYLDLRELSAGKYHLFLEAEDPASGQKAVALHRFSLFKPQDVATTLTAEDVQLMLDIAWHHLSEGEKIQVNKLTESGKANLIRQFWRDKDDDPSTPENPVYDEAVRRFAYANENFSTHSEIRNGWRTDRGRVYITYGEYDEWYEEFIHGESYPYILWKYYKLKEGNTIFVFVNDFVAGAIDYRLVHSTHPREKYDPAWKDILETDDVTDEDWRRPLDDY
jgi:GWxTD domain-containing protein